MVSKDMDLVNFSLLNIHTFEPDISAIRLFNFHLCKAPKVSKS